jgi:molybdopterin-guanine dinucleotide biosynthesis protein A
MPATRIDPAEITAAILAGGAGTRLGGRDKGLEMLAGKPLIAHVIEALRGQCGGLLICANRNPQTYARFAPVCADAAPGFHGPLAGIAAALAACQTDWLLTLPVDCPRPPAHLAQRLRTGAGSTRAGVARTQRVEPLFAVYRRELAAEAAAALVRDEPVWRWQQQIGAVEVDFTDVREAFMNLNTAGDFRRWEQGDHG